MKNSQKHLSKKLMMHFSISEITRWELREKVVTKIQLTKSDLVITNNSENGKNLEIKVKNQKEEFIRNVVKIGETFVVKKGSHFFLKNTGFGKMAVLTKILK